KSPALAGVCFGEEFAAVRPCDRDVAYRQRCVAGIGQPEQARVIRPQLLLAEVHIGLAHTYARLARRTRRRRWRWRWRWRDRWRQCDRWRCRNHRCGRCQDSRADQRQFRHLVCGVVENPQRSLAIARRLRGEDDADSTLLAFSQTSIQTIVLDDSELSCRCAYDADRVDWQWLRLKIDQCGHRRRAGLVYFLPCERQPPWREFRLCYRPVEPRDQSRKQNRSSQFESPRRAASGSGS